MRTRLQIVLLAAGLMAVIGCTKQVQQDRKNASGSTLLTGSPSESDKGKKDTDSPVDSNDTPPPPKPLPPRDTTLPPTPPFNDGPCAEVFCTTDVVEIGLEVLDRSGNRVTLDAFHTEDMNGKVLNTNLYYYNSDILRYVVFNDFWVMGHQNTNTQVRFVGIKGGVRVVNEVYSVSTDCCHINRTSGKTVVTIP